MEVSPRPVPDGETQSPVRDRTGRQTRCLSPRPTDFILFPLKVREVAFFFLIKKSRKICQVYKKEIIYDRLLTHSFVFLGLFSFLRVEMAEGASVIQINYQSNM